MFLLPRLLLLLFKNPAVYQQGQLKHLNRGQATSMELDSVIWKRRYSGNFKKPRKASNVDNWCFLKHELINLQRGHFMYQHRRITGTIQLQNPNIFVVSVADKFMRVIVHMVDLFFCPITTMYVCT